MNGCYNIVLYSSIALIIIVLAFLLLIYFGKDNYKNKCNKNKCNYTPAPILGYKRKIKKNKRENFINSSQIIIKFL